MVGAVSDMAARIAALEASLQATLAREVASQARHDAKLDALEVKVARMRGALQEIEKHPENHSSKRRSFGVGWAFFNCQNIAREALEASHE